MQLVSLETAYSNIPATDNVDKAKLRMNTRTILSKALPGEDVNDTNYIFLTFRD